MTKISTVSALAFLVAIILVWTNTACDQKPQGRKLAELYCSACHLFPEPDLLDKKTWLEGVLPQMSIRMGLTDPDVSLFAEDEYQRVLINGGLPLKPLINQYDWEKVVEYYRENAPEKVLPQQNAQRIDTNQTDFKSEILWQSAGTYPNFSLLKYLPQQQRLFAGKREGNIYIFKGKQLNLEDSLRAPSSPSDIQISTQGNVQLLLMGHMDPSDWYTGALVEVGKKDGHWQMLRRLRDSLNRPVHFINTDMNEDQKEDFLISEFGHFLGRLAWQEPLGKGKSTERDLFRGPGARVAHVADLDQDGKKDIIALLTQGDEQIIWYKNLGKGIYEGRQLARFLPIYGSSYLEVVDINKDGKLDLIHSAGDNYDYSYALKRYHGIRILINQGNQTFKEEKFLPLHGAGKVLVEDFDQDGNLDLACTAYFPDFTQKPLAGFVLYKNKGKLQFTAHTYPLTNMANWLLMDKGDLDQDGDVDIVLGACSINNTVPKPLREQWHKQGIGVLLLRNQLK